VFGGKKFHAPQFQNFVVHYQNQTTGEARQIAVSGETAFTLADIDAESGYTISVAAVDQHQQTLALSAKETWLGTRSRQLREHEVARRISFK